MVSSKYSKLIVRVSATFKVMEFFNGVLFLLLLTDNGKLKICYLNSMLHNPVYKCVK